MHDDSRLASERVACLDVFNTGEEALPIDPDLLPVLVVCVLEGNGPALLHPPNAPYMFVMLRSAVTVAQRCILLLWLDEVSYFL